ncbi:trna-dihydrouridine synthase [Holotrichia oblita]|uniref:Trna-dihydrouridine synthase n=1 Tax=Holotrichia oblita TaxID=644536 RepID=A0ACB9TPH0_HOLOL|nr:trna-dihydrouridine synthase [Holotrichia oblita]
MILADSFHKSVKARRNEFTTNSFDTPLVTQFAANNVNDFVEASKIVAPYCDGVDLNCGCPQRWAKQMGIGCVMLENPELITDLVKQCRNQIPKPFTVSVKMRLLKDMKSTIEICRMLDKCGVSYLSVHGRTASQLTGEVDPTCFKMIVENVRCPVIVNGGVKYLEECYQLQETTQCKGVMVANSILTNPMLFSGCEKTDMDCIQNWVDICYNSTLSDYEYSDVIHTQSISEKPPYLTFQCFHHHLVFMLEKVLPRHKRRIFNNLQKFSDVLDFLDVEFNIKPKLFDIKNSNKYRILPLWTSELEGDIQVDENYYEANSGKFFSSKANVTDQNQDDNDYDLADIFIEN